MQRRDPVQESFISDGGESNPRKVVYFLASVYVAIAFVACFILEPNNAALCDSVDDDLGFENPAYKQGICRNIRFRDLFYLTVQECSFGRRMIIALILGALIGWERRREDRPAAIRTMSLVSLGSCLFCICSTFSFESGPMTWDSARVAAAIPSGVGFLGAGLIFKNAEKNDLGDMEHSVHGITTAVSLWISAAVGIACGGELYFVALYSVGVMMLLQRFSPRSKERVAKVIVPNDFIAEICQRTEMESLASQSLDNFMYLSDMPASARFLKSSNSIMKANSSMRSDIKSIRPQLME